MSNFADDLARAIAFMRPTAEAVREALANASERTVRIIHSYFRALRKWTGRTLRYGALPGFLMIVIGLSFPWGDPLTALGTLWMVGWTAWFAVVATPLGLVVTATGGVKEAATRWYNFVLSFLTALVVFGAFAIMIPFHRYPLAILPATVFVLGLGLLGVQWKSSSLLNRKVVTAALTVACTLVIGGLVLPETSRVAGERITQSDTSLAEEIEKRGIIGGTSYFIADAVRRIFAGLAEGVGVDNALLVVECGSGSYLGNNDLPSGKEVKVVLKQGSAGCVSPYISARGFASDSPVYFKRVYSQGTGDGDSGWLLDTPGTVTRPPEGKVVIGYYFRLDDPSGPARAEITLFR